MTSSGVKNPICKNDHKIDSLIHNSELLNLLNLNEITTFTKVQIKAIRNRLFFHQNLLICSPSGSGKTLIGLLAIANLLLNFSGNAIYLVPYKSLAQEKELQFQHFFQSLNIQVQAITSDNDDPLSVLDSYKIIITTYEKCDALLRMNHPYLEKTRCIIVDEIHEIGLNERGGRLEFLLVRLFHYIPIVQIIALSATIGNAKQLTNWLSHITRPFRLIYSDFRPIPLKYFFLKYTNKIASIRQICKNIIEQKGQIIIFVSTRKKCIRYGIKLKKTITKLLNQEEIQELEQIQNKLKENHSFAPNLDELLLNGIAYHNASLSYADRKLVEEAFKQKKLKILIATTTLAAGINLPARAVILTDIYQYQKYWKITNHDFTRPNAKISPSGNGVVYPIDPNMFFQMLGRAGRMGYDHQGDAFILVKNKAELEFVQNYYFEIKKIFIQEKQEQSNSIIDDSNCHLPKKAKYQIIPRYKPLQSQLNNIDLLEELILLLIQNTPGISEEQIHSFLNDTFYAFQKYQCGKNSQFNEVLKKLFIVEFTISDFIKNYQNSSCLHASLPNKATFKDIRFSKITPNLIEATLYYSHSRYHITLSQNTKISCSCQPSNHWEGIKVNYLLSADNLQIKPLCSHIINFLEFVESQSDSSVKTLVLNLLNNILKHEYVISYLIENGFISQPLDQRGYFVSKLGKLTTHLFLSPKDMIKYQLILQESKKKTTQDLLTIAITLYRNKNPGNNEEIDSFIHGWIEEHTMEDILDHHPKLSVGDLFQIKRELERILKILEAISLFFAQNSSSFSKKYMLLAQKFRLLALRTNHGVKEDILQLMETFPKLSRNRGRLLNKVGFGSVQKILTTNLDEIAQATGIKRNILQKIFSDLINTSKKEEQKKQTLISSYIHKS